MVDEKPNEPRPDPLPRSDRALEVENADLRAENERLRAAVAPPVGPRTPPEGETAERSEDGGADLDEEDAGYLLGEDA